jgi:hypothetical protein
MEFFNKFRNDPKAPGINYEKINSAKDKKFRSVRIDEAYRGIVVREEDSGTYILLWVDRHDEAYEWARKKKCEVNPCTGNVQVFDVQFIEAGHTQYEGHEKHENRKKLFAHVSDYDLLTMDVPAEQLAFVRDIDSEEAFHQSKNIKRNQSRRSSANRRQP